MKKDLTNSALNKLFLRLQQDFNAIPNSADSPKDMWDYPMTLVKEIEEQIDDNVDIIYDIIAKVKIEKKQLTNNNAIVQYHIIFAKVYCLLYYKYRNDEFYKNCVLNPLWKQMVIFSDGWKLGILKKLDKIFEEEEKNDKLKKERMSDENKSYSQSDVDRIVNDYESKLNEKEETINQLTEKIELLEKKINEIIGEDDEQTDTPLTDEEIAEIKQKIKIELALQLFDLANDKYVYSKKGNKVIVAKLISCITSIPIQTIENYLSNRLKKTAIPKASRKQLDEVKQILEDTGLKWRKIELRGY